MKRLLAAAVAVALFALPLTAQADEQCPDPTRPIHVLPFCLSEAEYMASWAPPPPPVDSGPVSVSPEANVRVMAAHFWPDWAVERMVRIAKCESGFDPNAQHPRSKASGIWQIMPFWQRDWPGDYFDPWTNAAVAYQIWLVQGFGAWVCRG